MLLAMHQAASHGSRTRSSKRKSTACATPTDSTGVLKGVLLADGLGSNKRKRSTRQLRPKSLKTPEEKIAFRMTKLEERTDPKRFKTQTPLEKLAVSAPVAMDCLRRMKELEIFAKKNRLSLKNTQRFDEVCCRFVNSLFERGFDLQDGTKTLAAIIDSHPDFGPRQMLPRTRRALQGWAKTEPQQTRPPLPWVLVSALAVNMMQRQQHIAAMAILLMFTAYLRPGEAMDLQVRDLIAPMPGQGGFPLHLHPAERREQSKVGLSDESLLLNSPLMPWLGPALQFLPRKTNYLLDLTYDQLVNQWKMALTRLGLAANHAVLYQLRHSGPSHDRFHQLRSALEVKQRGRWQSDHSVRRYEAHARINQEFHLLPKAVQTHCLKMEQVLPRMVRGFISQKQ